MVSQARTEHWEIVGDSSRLTFSLRHIVVSEILGLFRTWGGEMLFDPDDMSRARIRIWVDLASIDTGSAERNDHVRSKEFLHVAQFPRAEFTSTQVVPRQDGAAALTGWLQLHGIARYVALTVVAERTWVDDDGHLRAAYRVHGEIDRQAFGLHWNQDLDFGGIVVGDRVEIQAHVELVRTADASFARPDPSGEITADSR